MSIRPGTSVGGVWSQVRPVRHARPPYALPQQPHFGGRSWIEIDTSSVHQPPPSGGGELHRDAEPTACQRDEGQRSVVCLGDAVDDRQTEADAQDDGVAFHLNSGWRSRAYQTQLRRDAVHEYGSEAEAARWVATADTSPHVSGEAIDIGPADAREWLSEHGTDYGLCQIYRNEPWHYELRPGAADRGCPPLYADPTDDPRMHH